MEDLLPRWLVYMAVGSRPLHLSTWASPKGCLNILTIWPLASSRTNDPGEQDASHNVFFKKQCYLYILAMLSLCCCTGFSLVVEGAGATLWLWGTGFSLQWLSCRRAQALGHMGFSGWGMSVHSWCRGLVALGHMGSSQIRDPTCVFCLGRRILHHWATREAT